MKNEKWKIKKKQDFGKVAKSPEFFIFIQNNIIFSFLTENEKQKSPNLFISQSQEMKKWEMKKILSL